MAVWFLYSTSRLYPILSSAPFTATYRAASLPRLSHATTPTFTHVTRHFHVPRTLTPEKDVAGWALPRQRCKTALSSGHVCRPRLHKGAFRWLHGFCRSSLVCLSFLRAISLPRIPLSSQVITSSSRFTGCAAPCALPHVPALCLPYVAATAHFCAASPPANLPLLSLYVGR